MEVTSIDCVLCSSKREFNKYVRIESDESTTSVDYISIITKLIKSDFHDVEPHPFIVGMAIKNALNNIRKKQNSDRVISPKGKYDTLFPVKGVIYDVRHSDSIVEYQIRISHFYDDINFIKRHFISAQFERDFEGKMIHLRTKYSKFKSIKEFNEHIVSANFIVVVDGPMV